MDRFTEWHLRILRLVGSPAKWTLAGKPAAPPFALIEVLEDAYPELRGQPDFSNLIWADLYNAGLVQTPTMRPRLDAEGQVLKGTSELGDAFLEFIEDSL